MAILNIQRQSISWLVAEFLVVVLGVAVALAADSYREDIGNSEIEREYLTRLTIELEIGTAQLLNQNERTKQAQDATEGLLRFYYSGESSNDSLIENFIYAAQTGGTESDLTHDVTYRELVSTGRLNIITNGDLRNQISRYFNQIDNLKTQRSYLPNYVIQLYSYTVGEIPETYTIRGESLNEAARMRVLKEINENQQLERELRRQSAILGLLSRSIEESVERNQDLLSQLK